MKIRLAHGGGGRETRALINDLIQGYLGNPILDKMEDAAVLTGHAQLAFTTDSFVVKPLFFPGGDIGTLCVCGTTNDLAVMGARPSKLSLALILEEGLDIDILEKVLQSIRNECRQGGLEVVCGDTKVVEKGACDALFINTSGIGFYERNVPFSLTQIQEGDVLLLSGFSGDHGAAILNARHSLDIQNAVLSDCAQLYPLVSLLQEAKVTVHAMRDATRGGVAAVANEMADASGLTAVIEESMVPVRASVAAFCDLLGLSPLELANEGKLVVALPEKEALKALALMRNHSLGQQAAVIGKMEKRSDFSAVLQTGLGIRRILEMPRGEHLPRIC